MGGLGERFKRELSEVIILIKQEKWEEAYKYSDNVCYNAVINNEDFIWENEIDVAVDVNKFNSCSWGNVAILIHFGEQFPDRRNDIIKLKETIKEIIRINNL